MGNVDRFLRIFLPCYLIAYILITYTLNVASFRKKYGIDPRVTRKSDAIVYLCEVYRDVMFAAILAMVAVYAAFPRLYAYFVPIPYMSAPLIRFGGALVLLAALVLVRLSQHQLGRAWRIGIDRSGDPIHLTTTGLYGISRNPIALGMTLSAVGMFLALPNVVTFAIVNLTILLFHVRIRVEEEHLMRTLGEPYKAYRQRTPRWL